jgi:hypothetical protein
MCALAGDQELGVAALGVQRVRGHYVPGQVHVVQQRGEPGDLVGLAVHAELAQDRAGLLAR